MTERVLCVVAHPDDETLGCGGTLAKHVAMGDAAMVVVLADGVTSRDSVPQHSLQRRQECVGALRALGVGRWGFADWPDQRLDTVPRLALIKDVEDAIATFGPTIVYTHHGSDCNLDHRIVNDAVCVACRPLPSSMVKGLFFFEVPSSSEYQVGHAPFQPNWFVDVGETLLTKIKAFRAYASEIRDIPHPRSVDAIRHLAYYRGASVGLAAAEAFVVGRAIC